MYVGSIIKMVEIDNDVTCIIGVEISEIEAILSNETISPRQNLN